CATWTAWRSASAAPIARPRRPRRHPPPWLPGPSRRPSRHPARHRTRPRVRRHRNHPHHRNHRRRHRWPAVRHHTGHDSPPRLSTATRRSGRPAGTARQPCRIAGQPCGAAGRPPGGYGHQLGPDRDRSAARGAGRDRAAPRLRHPYRADLHHELPGPSPAGRTESRFVGVENYRQVAGEFPGSVGLAVLTIAVPLLGLLVVAPLLAWLAHRAGTAGRRIARLALTFPVVLFAPAGAA